MPLKLWITRIPRPYPMKANPGRKPGVIAEGTTPRDQDEEGRPTKEPPLFAPDVTFIKWSGL